jgi:2-dehydro-3-deoxyphosphooctonate aldolase (KDO 8-P synthase)
MLKFLVCIYIIRKENFKNLKKEKNMKAFRHYATKIASVVLVLAMLASMGVGLVSVSAATEVKVNPAAAAGTNGDVAIKADGNDSLAMRIKVNSAFSYYSVQLASYSSSFVAKAHVALYKWDFSYAKTVASTPVQEATVTINNDRWHKQTLSSNAPAGEYLIEVTGISTTYERGVIAWFGNLGTNAISGGCVYRQGTPVKTADGKYTGEMRVSFGFTSSPSTNFTPITGHPVEVPTYGETGTYNSSHYYRLAPVNDVVAQRLVEINSKLGAEVIFKASFDKANRTSLSSYRGVGIDKGLQMLADVKAKRGLKLCTDIHEAWQAAPAGEVIDVIQIPAFLCRQTDLLVAAAKTGRTVNIKKAQFLSGEDMKYPYEKAIESGAKEVWLTERGNMYGYNNLVVDFRNIADMLKISPTVVMDCTHSVQRPGAAGGKTGGNREFVPAMAEAAKAFGANGFFFEVHPTPDAALSDGPNMLPLDELESVVARLL